MKLSFRQRSLVRMGAAVVATAALGFVGVGVAHADPSKTITSGHIDAVTITCSNVGGVVVYDVHTTISSNPHGADEVATGSGAGQIGDYRFVHDESASPSAVEWDSGEYAVLTGAGGSIADIGFSYECGLSAAASSVSIDMANTGALDVWAMTAAGSASNTNSNVITLPRTGANHHLHGNWYFEAPSRIQYDYELTFNVNIPGKPTQVVSPFTIRVQP